MTGIIVLCCLSMAALLHSSTALPVDLVEELLDARATDPAYRLSQDFVPEEYLIQLYNIDLVEAKFSGSSEVTLVAKVDRNTLVIHSADLTGTSDLAKVKIINLSTPAESMTVTTIVPNTKYATLTITVNPGFKKDSKYRLTFNDFTGIMSSTAMRGFYVSKYTENQKTELMGTTQMQPGHARKVFPCFDEPFFKAKFSLSIERPGIDANEYKASVSNMVGSVRRDPATNRIWDIFEQTPVMSTYLLAFVVSKFSALEETNVGGNLFRVLGRPEAKGQEEYAFKEGQDILKAMDEYTGIKYYEMGNKKMDQAAIPDFSAGAMENWGLLIYREAYLLSGNLSTNVRYNQFISTIVAHEIAHMWFGDYVTCHWWSDTWLNEGFATLFEYKLPDLTETNYQMNIQFPISVVQRALLGDTASRTAALTNINVNSPEEVSGHFSVISYQKGAAIIRMIEHWIGEEKFKEALSAYLDDHKYKTVTPADLYAALQKKAQAGQNVENVMSTWVKESGYPLITVSVNYGEKTMSISQSRFNKAWEAEQDTIYQVPITYATKSKADFNNTAADYLLTGKDGANIPITVGGEEWIVLNKQQIGYYRVNYDDKTWDILRSALIGSERTNIHQINRAQIVDDLFNLAREGVISYNTTLDVMEFLRHETEYAPWSSAIAGFSFIRQQFNAKRSLSGKLHNHIFNLMEKLVKDTLGFTDEGDLLTQLFRLNAMNFACSLGQEDCVKYATETFQAYEEKDESVPANHREFVYCTGLREGSNESYSKLWDKYKAENVVNEKVVILGALGCTKAEYKINELLNEITKDNSEIRDQDVMTPINSILNGNPENSEYVLKYMEEDFSKLRKRLGSYSALFTNLGSRLTGNQIGRFYQLIMDNYGTLTSGEISAGFAAYNNLAQQGDYLLKAGDEIEIWLNEKYRSSGVLATSSFMLLCVVLLAHLFNVQL